MMWSLPFSLFVVVTGLVALPLSVALGQNGGVCCACVAGDNATSAGAPNGDLIPALFCAEIQGKGGFVSFSEACSAKWGSVVCADPPPCATSDEEGECQVASHPSCAAQLAAEGIACPTAPVPVASIAPLGALAVGLVAVGTVLLARRRHRGV